MFWRASFTLVLVETRENEIEAKRKKEKKSERHKLTCSNYDLKITYLQGFLKHGAYSSHSVERRMKPNKVQMMRVRPSRHTHRHRYKSFGRWTFTTAIVCTCNSLKLCKQRPCTKTCRFRRRAIRQPTNCKGKWPLLLPPSPLSFCFCQQTLLSIFLNPQTERDRNRNMYRNRNREVSKVLHLYAKQTQNKENK